MSEDRTTQREREERPARIVLVEDDDGVRELLTTSLVLRGHEVSPCADLAAAGVALAERSPDLVITDVGLPDGSGLDLVARLRGESGRSIPVVVISADTDEAVISKALAVGAVDYITKPFPPSVLLAKVARLLAGRPRPSEAGEPLPQVGRYQLLRLLGRGSFGAVYEASDPVSGRRVALKLLDPVSDEDREVRLRFLRETSAMAAVQHPHLASISDFGVAADGRLYYAMSLVPGPTVHARVDLDGPADEAQCVGLLRGSGAALDVLEQGGILHRDIKPANIILRHGRWELPVLVDFGLAKRRGERALTDKDVVMGTPGYLSPEAIIGEPLDARSDLFALGLVARFCLTGEEVFPELQGMALLQALSTRQVEPPAWVSAPLGAVLGGLLERDVRGRTGSARQLLAELDRLPPPPPGPRPPGGTPTRAS